MRRNASSDSRCSSRVGPDPGHPRSGSASAGPPIVVVGGPALATRACPTLPLSTFPTHNWWSRRNAAFTLLEVVLALGLTVVVLGLVGMGIHVQLAVAAKSATRSRRPNSRGSCCNALPTIFAMRSPSSRRPRLPRLLLRLPPGPPGRPAPRAFGPRTVPIRPLPPARPIRTP